MKRIMMILACMLFVCIQAYAESKPDEGSINAESKPDGGRTKTGQVIQLTDGAEYYKNPVFSPDGQLIAFTRHKHKDILVMNADGSAKRQLVDGDGVGYKVAWSVDGGEIAFRKTEWVDNERFNAICAVTVVSGTTQTLTARLSECAPPQWYMAVDGKRVSYVADGQIHLSEPIGQVSSAAMEVLSKQANANKVLCFRDDNIHLLEINGRSQQLTSDTGFDPVWSPDRKQFVYSNWDNLVVMNIDTGKKVKLGFGSNPSWSPDGKKLVYQVTKDNGEVITASDLFIINADGSDKTRLTRTVRELEANPCWSPDGQTIVYNSESTGKIYKLVYHPSKGE